jgi:surface antigen
MRALLHRRSHFVAVFAVFVVGSVAAAVLATGAAAAPVPSTHSLPGSAAAGVTQLCGPNPAYACTTGGYGGLSAGWPGALYGAGYANRNQYGYHNCTLYAAYRLSVNGMVNPGWSDNATGWDTKAAAHGTPVDQTPALGAIAQWNRGLGHVAYVEVVAQTYIEVSDDSYDPMNTHRWRIMNTSPSWPDNFIHFRDLGGAGGGSGVQAFIRGDASIFGKATLGPDGWTQEVGPGNAKAIAVGGTTQVFLRGDGAVFAKSTIGVGGWTQEADPGTATAVAVSSTGVQMIITSDASVFAKNWIGNGGWVQEVGPGNAKAIAVGANTQLFLRGDNAVFAKATIGNGGWTQEAGPGTVTTIAVGSTGAQMIIAADASIYAKNTIGNGGWIQEVGPGNANSIAIG